MVHTSRIVQLISTARDLPVGHAIAEAFVCAVTALLLIYVAALLDIANHANHTRFFSMPAAGAAGLFSMDAAIGRIGLVLRRVRERDRDGAERGGEAHRRRK